MTDAAVTQERILIIAAVVTDLHGRVLLVRKSGSDYFMQPGGKPKPGEYPLDTLARELEEELGCGIDRENAEHFGSFEAPAANEPGCIVFAELYRVSLLGKVTASSEILEFKWVSRDNPEGTKLAPLTTAYVLPSL